ncbi:DUF4037 domain-containing protein [Microbispora sp. NEAU-D428]|uniref:DUF4037 domain-containing protein n=1 Tax=Microbispora sitophila TaxID=2771537 RepID=UPI001867B05D|nr:DUF4037 domain-containing protein [Microbispora sitophila]MBE3010957.1 DUF4037 domain-containing protein [Microbispora sitophila]
MGDGHVRGLELSRRFYLEAVAPLLARRFGGLTHTAALLGPGSEVLGYDTERSTDHDWGPRLQLFLGPEDAAAHGEAVDTALAESLPPRFLGYPTNFGPPASDGTRRMETTDGPRRHGVVPADLTTWLTGHLGFDPLAGVGLTDWLATPTQTLAEVTAGEVFHDGLGLLLPVRRRLAWYPDDVWRYVLACQWRRICQEEAFVGRAGEAGDELGSAVTCARLVRDLIRLALLMHRRYPPYGKWLGSAFAALPCGPDLAPVLRAAVSATGRWDRERHLATAYEALAALHNALGLTRPVDPRTRPYHDRPYRVLRAERFTEALLETITDPEVRRLPLTGTVDQYVDSTDVLCDRSRVRRVADAVRR